MSQHYLLSGSTHRSAYPHLVREFPFPGELRAGLDHGASLLLAYLPPSHAASESVRVVCVQWMRSLLSVPTQVR